MRLVQIMPQFQLLEQHPARKAKTAIVAPRLIPYGSFLGRKKR